MNCPRCGQLCEGGRCVTVGCELHGEQVWLARPEVEPARPHIVLGLTEEELAEARAAGKVMAAWLDHAYDNDAVYVEAEFEKAWEAGRVLKRISDKISGRMVMPYKQEGEGEDRGEGPERDDEGYVR